MPDTLVAAASDEDERAAATSSREAWLRRALVLVVVAPVVVAAVAWIGRDYQPVADWALIELNVRDVGSHTPLLGPFSRYGWNHPGPLLFWVLAIPYRLFGSSSEALLLGAGAINAASVVGALAVVWRRGRWPLLVLTALALALLLRGVGAGFLVDPWNPYVTMLPFALLLVTVWAIACGEVRLSPVAVVAGAFLVETHVGYTPVVGALVAWAAIGLWLARRRPAAPDERREPVVRWLAASAVVGLVLAAPMLLEQLTNRPGNLVEIVRHFTDGDETSAGLARASRVMGQHLALPGIWATGDEPLDPFVGELVGGTAWWTLPALAALATAGWVTWRRQLADAGRLVVTVAVALAVGVVTISRTTDAMFPYLFQWMRPVAMLLWVAVAWVVHLALPDAWRERASSWGGPVLVGATAVVTLFTCFSSTELIIDEGPVDEAVVALAPATIAAAGDGPVLIWPVGGCLDWVANGLVLELERARVPVRATEGDAHRYGDHRVFDGSNADRSVVVACRGQIDAFADDPAYEEVARFSPLTPDEEDDFEAARQALLDEAAAEGRDDLVPFIENGAIALFDTETGLDEAILGRYRALQADYDERVVVYAGPPVPEAAPS